MESYYPGLAFHPQFEHGNAAGSIVVGADSIRFVVEGGMSSPELPYAGMVLTSGGATGDQFYFRHNAVPDWTITTADRAIFQNPYLLNHPELAPQVKTAHRARNAILAASLLLVFLFVGIIVGLIAAKEPLVTAAAEMVPASAEVTLGDTVFTQIKATTPMIEDKHLVQQLEKMAEPLLAAIPDKRWAFKLHLANAKEPNAFALPGGNIVVHSGLILEAERPEEVVGVLAHEIAHVTKRHSIRQLISRAGLAIALQVFVGDVEGLIGVVVSGGSHLLTQSYSRDYEHEADAVGWEYLLAAGVDPSGLRDFFQRLEKLEQKGNAPSVPTLLSTHPATEDRIAWLEKQWAKQTKKESFKPIPVDFAEFKAKLKERTK